MNGLRYVRIRCNLSLSDLADLIGVTRQALSSWENGKKKIPEQRRRQLSEFFGIEKVYLGEISEKQKQSLLERAMFRQWDGLKEYYLYKPCDRIDRTDGESEIRNMDHKRVCFPENRRIRLDEELVRMRRKKQKTLERAENMITWTSPTDSLESQILCIRRGCVAYDMLSELLETMRGMKPTLKMPFFYELVDVWKAMHLAYGLLEEDQLQETDCGGRRRESGIPERISGIICRLPGWNQVATRRFMLWLLPELPLWIWSQFLRFQ